MAPFQCTQLSKGTTPGHIKGWSGIWRSHAFWGLTPKSNRARSLCDVGTSRYPLWLQKPLKQNKHDHGVKLYSISVLTNEKKISGLGVLLSVRSNPHHKMSLDTLLGASQGPQTDARIPYPCRPCHECIPEGWSGRQTDPPRLRTSHS